MNIYDSSKVLSDYEYKVREYADNTLYVYQFDNGIVITILDRLTGFGWRDVETGLRIGKDFWLASGNIDVMRDCVGMLMDDVVLYIKKYANTCKPEE